MSAPESAVPLEVLRSAVQRALAAGSVRSLSAEVGLSGTALRHFASKEGSEPFESSRRKLTAWYLGRVADGREELDEAAARAALAVLVDHLPEKEREKAAREIRAFLKKRSEAAGVKPPGWVNS